MSSNYQGSPAGCKLWININLYYCLYYYYYCQHHQPSEENQNSTTSKVQFQKTGWIHAPLKVTKNSLSLFSRLLTRGSFYDIKTVLSLQKEKILPHSILEKSRKINI